MRTHTSYLSIKQLIFSVDDLPSFPAGPLKKSITSLKVGRMKKRRRERSVSRLSEFSLPPKPCLAAEQRVISHHVIRDLITC